MPDRRHPPCGPAPARLRWRRRLAAAALLLSLLGGSAALRAQDQPEYRLKAAILYNFILYSEWPGPASASLLVCVVGRDPFAAELDALAGKTVGSLGLRVARRSAAETLRDCQVLFVAPSAMPALPALLESVRGSAVLTVADTPGAAAHGVALNMALSQGRVSFEANVSAARAAGITLSSKLLRFATEVLP